MFNIDKTFMCEYKFFFVKIKILQVLEIQHNGGAVIFLWGIIYYFVIYLFIHTKNIISCQEIVTGHRVKKKCRMNTLVPSAYASNWK